MHELFDSNLKHNFQLTRGVKHYKALTEVKFVKWECGDNVGFLYCSSPVWDPMYLLDGFLTIRNT